MTLGASRKSPDLHLELGLVRKEAPVVTYLWLAALTILVFLCFTGPDGGVRTDRRH